MVRVKELAALAPAAQNRVHGRSTYVAAQKVLHGLIDRRTPGTEQTVVLSPAAVGSSRAQHRSRHLPCYKSRVIKQWQLTIMTIEQINGLHGAKDTPRERLVPQP